MNKIMSELTKEMKKQVEEFKRVLVGIEYSYGYDGLAEHNLLEQNLIDSMQAVRNEAIEQCREEIERVYKAGGFSHVTRDYKEADRLLNTCLIALTSLISKK